MTVRIFKQELDLKLKNISEKPNDILKRLDKFADLPKTDVEGKGMFCYSVIVRVFQKEMDILEEELEKQRLDEAQGINGAQQDDEDDDDDEEEAKVVVEEEEVKIGEHDLDLEPFKYY